MRLPITLPILMRLIASFIASFKHTTKSAYQLHMLSAMCSSAFFAFLRIGEITINSSNHSNLIMLPQLEQLLNSQGQVTALQLTISKYKHSDTGRPFVIYIYKEDLCCPVKTTLHFISTRGTACGPLFCWPDGAPIVKLVPALYKSHTFRIGAATWAAAKGFTDTPIRQLGRWKSNAFLQYIRTPSLSTKVFSLKVYPTRRCCGHLPFIYNNVNHYLVTSLRVGRVSPSGCLWPFFSCPHLC